MKKEVKLNSKAVAISFNWIFALIVGGFILFLAIYGVNRFVDVSESTIGTETADTLVSFFESLETGLSSGNSDIIEFRKESKLNFDCDEFINRPFGRNTISISEKTFGNNFGEESNEISTNKYVFAEDQLIGNSLDIFSKPFFLGYKVSDIIVVNNKEFCFIEAPDEFKEGVKGLGLTRLKFVDDRRDCQGIEVCFDGGTCGIKVFTDIGYVVNDKFPEKKMYYVDNLVYGAIFSTPDIYECNVKRLKSRYDELAKIYLDKIRIIERAGCFSRIGGELTSSLGPINNSRDMIFLKEEVKSFDSSNRGVSSNCRVYDN